MSSFINYFKYFVAGVVAAIGGYLLVGRNKYRKKAKELAIAQHTKLLDKAVKESDKAKQRISKNQEKLRDLQVNYFTEYDGFYTYKGDVPGVDRAAVDRVRANRKKGK